MVGVAPERFGGTTAIIGTEFFAAARRARCDRERLRFARSIRALGSPQPLADSGRTPEAGITRAQADEQLKVIAAAHEQAYPVENKNQDLIVRPLGRLGHQHQSAGRHRSVGAGRNAAGTRGGGAAHLVPQSREHDAGVRIRAAKRDRDPSRRRRRPLAHRPSAAGAGTAAVAERRRTGADRRVVGGATCSCRKSPTCCRSRSCSTCRRICEWCS